ncbi:hypothetical protein KA005_84250, partial [bacterium]|nr:hypothetical protein [bacterium]
KQCEHFIDCTEQGVQPKSDGYYSGLRVVSVLEAASKSLQRGGQSVPVFYPDNYKKLLSTIVPQTFVTYG